MHARQRRTRLEQTLKALGAKHVDYGVTDEMYPMVASALMDTLEHASGEHWNNAVRDAWIAALTFVAERMQAGARMVGNASAAE